MKLLFDQNLSPKLPERLNDLYPDSAHVAELGLDRAMDRDVWHFAREHRFVIVTKDADFGELSMLFGLPPYVVWIRRGNCSTRDIEQILRHYFEVVRRIGQDDEHGVLMLS